MAEQNYRNHLKFYAPHHFVFYPLITVCAVMSGIHAAKEEGNSMIWVAITLVFVFMAWLSYMMRQHYALTLQNRLVRLEMRLRYFQLTGKKLEALEYKLSFGQIAALRFAGDEELEPLIEQALKENLSPKEIKKRVTNWQADHMRV